MHHKKSGTPATLEGKVVSVADRIAYLNHDIDDAIRAGVIAESDLPAACLRVLGDSHGRRINAMILDIVAHSTDRPEIVMSDAVLEQFQALRELC